MPSLTPTKRAEFGCDGCGHTTQIDYVPRDAEIDGIMECGNPDCAMEYTVTFLVSRNTPTRREVAEAEAAALAEPMALAKRGKKGS